MVWYHELVPSQKNRFVSCEQRRNIFVASVLGLFFLHISNKNGNMDYKACSMTIFHHAFLVDNVEHYISTISSISSDTFHLTLLDQMRV